MKALIILLTIFVFFVITDRLELVSEGQDGYGVQYVTYCTTLRPMVDNKGNYVLTHNPLGRITIPTSKAIMIETAETICP
jgi:hypothetical protein